MHTDEFGVSQDGLDSSTYDLVVDISTSSDTGDAFPGALKTTYLSLTGDPASVMATDDRVLVIPADTTVVGRVTEAIPLRKVGGQAALGLEFTAVDLRGRRVQIDHFEVAVHSHDEVGNNGGHRSARSHPGVGRLGRRPVGCRMAELLGRQPDRGNHEMFTVFDKWAQTDYGRELATIASLPDEPT